MLVALMTSCSNEAKLEEPTSENKVVDLSKYKDVVYANRQLLSEWGYAAVDAEEEQTRSAEEAANQSFEELKSNLLPAAIQFVEELDISIEDMESMTEEKIDGEKEYEEAIVGLMLFVTATDCNIAEDETLTRGGSFKDCFIEATGIAAGIVIVGGLTKGAVSKKVVRATLKMVAKVGTRTLSGVGLALIAAEIAWCMY